MKKMLMALITLFALPIMVNAEEPEFLEPIKGSAYYDHIWTTNYTEKTTSINGINEFNKKNAFRNI